MKLPVNTQSPEVPKELQQFRLWADRRLSDIAKQLNGISEGVGFATHNAHTSAPTTGTYSPPDFVKNSIPTESGATGGMYVNLGWICVAAGTPGTWKECRVLTGN